MNTNNHRIAIISTNKRKYSETFIHAQVTGLPFHVFYLHTGYLPTKIGDDDQPLIKGNGNEETLKKAIKIFFIENQIQLVLAQYGPSGVKMMDICDALGIPLIVYFRGYDAYRQDMLDSYGKEYPELFQFASAIFTTSKAMQKQLERLGAPSEKIIYNPSGANTAVFKYHDAGLNPPVFIATGRFEASKSPHLTLLAFSRALHQIPEARLIMVGEGHLLEACKILVKALKIERAVEFKGILPQHEVASLMSQSRGFVQHSFTTPSNDTEGTPVAVMEAGASGLPVVATKHAGIPEVVEHEKTGFLVDEGDIDSMAEYIVKVGKNPLLATTLGKAGYEKIIVRYTTSISIDKVAAVIDKLIEQKAEKTGNT